MTPPPSLTPRESEILGHYLAGLGQSEIARQLGIDRKTVGYHLYACRTKLGYDSTHRMIVGMLTRAA